MLAFKLLNEFEKPLFKMRFYSSTLKYGIHNKIPIHGTFVYIYELFFHYCKMGEIPNNYDEQLWNSFVGRKNMRRIFNRYESLRDEQDLLLTEHESIRNAKNEEEKLLKIWAWKWTSIDGETQSWDEIVTEVQGLMTNGFISGEIWDQIINTNVDVLLDEADRFYTIENEGIRSYNNTQNKPVLDGRIYEILRINGPKFELAFDFTQSKKRLDSLSKKFEDLDNELETLQDELRELQRLINHYLEFTLT